MSVSRCLRFWREIRLASVFLRRSSRYFSSWAAKDDLAPAAFRLACLADSFVTEAPSDDVVDTAGTCTANDVASVGDEDVADAGGTGG